MMFKLFFSRSTILHNTLVYIILLIAPGSTMQECKLNKVSAALLEINCVKMTSTTFAEAEKNFSPPDKYSQYNLMITNSKLTVLHNDSFKLTYSEMTISNTTLKTIEPQVFSLQPQLEHLNLANNNIFNISSSFHNCTHLRKLNLASNQIKQLRNGDFPIYLQSLDLSNNKIGSVDTGIFAKMEFLHTLDLSRNNLHKAKHMSSMSFPQRTLGPKLTTSRFSHGAIPAGLFKPLTGLKYLNVSHNGLVNILPGTFEDLESLEILDLGYNKLSSLLILRRNLVNLKYLHIDHNMLTDLGMFSKPIVSTFTYIYMDNNQWNCADLLDIIYFKLNKMDKVMTGSHFYEANINGLRCFFNDKSARRENREVVELLRYTNLLLGNMNKIMIKYMVHEGIEINNK